MTLLESLKAEFQLQQLVTTVIIIGMLAFFSKLGLLTTTLCFISALLAGTVTRYWKNRA